MLVQMSWREAGWLMVDRCQDELAGMRHNHGRLTPQARFGDGSARVAQDQQVSSRFPFLTAR